MSDPCAAAPQVPLVNIERAQVNLEGHCILDNVEWQIYPGEHWGIVGANGSGKSTLLRLVEGTLWPAPGHGRRYYDFGYGRQTDAIQARQRVIAVGPELQNRYMRFGWNFRTLDVVRSGVTRTDIPRRNPLPDEIDQSHAIIERLGLAPLTNRRFLELSRGQQRRVLIARAVGFAPLLLLLDEPASGLDATARLELDDLLRGAAKTTTLVVSAHSEADLPLIVNHIATVENRTLVIGAPTRPDAQQAGPAPGNRAATLTPTADDDTQPLARIDNGSVYFAGHAVLRAIDWQIMPGEQWLIRGHNGSGKSTLLRLLHGQLRPAVGGSVSWPGLGNPANIWSLRRQIGLVSAELLAAYRYPVTVRECIGSGFDSSFGITRAMQPPEWGRVDALIEQFELGSLAARKLSALSYGQLHRTMIARTLVNQPRLLLLDEPWEGLDPATRALIADVLTGLMATGTQIVCASHIDEPGICFNRQAALVEGVFSYAYDRV